MVLAFREIFFVKFSLDLRYFPTEYEAEIIFTPLSSIQTKFYKLSWPSLSQWFLGKYFTFYCNNIRINVCYGIVANAYDIADVSSPCNVASWSEHETLDALVTMGTLPMKASSTSHPGIQMFHYAYDIWRGTT